MPRFEEMPTPQNYVEQVLADSQRILRAAVGIVHPENPEADPQKVFPAPNVPVRAEDEGLQLADDQKEELIARADELGFGRPENVTLSEIGLGKWAMVVLEGGQPHKMMAEARVVTEDRDATPKTIIFAASAQREVKSPAEIESATNLFGGDQTGKTEYDMAEQVIRALPGFREPFDFEVGGPLNFAYDIHNDFAVSSEVSGQMVRLGYLGPTTLDVSVHMLRVDREDYMDGDKPRYRKQPNTADLIGILDASQRLSYETSMPIAFVTSGAYRPSRAVLTALAGLRTGRQIGLVTYGNDLVNEVRGTDLPPPLNQLPGELQYMAEKTVELEAALQAHEA